MVQKMTRCTKNETDNTENDIWYHRNETHGNKNSHCSKNENQCTKKLDPRCTKIETYGTKNEKNLTFSKTRPTVLKQD